MFIRVFFIWASQPAKRLAVGLCSIPLRSSLDRKGQDQLPRSLCLPSLLQTG